MPQVHMLKGYDDDNHFCYFAHRSGEVVGRVYQHRPLKRGAFQFRLELKGTPVRDPVIRKILREIRRYLELWQD